MKRKVLFLNLDLTPEKMKEIITGLREHDVMFHNINRIGNALYDFDVIFIDMTSIGVDEWFRLYERRNETNQLLNSGGVIICHPTPMNKTNIIYESFPRSKELITKFPAILTGSYISNYSWLEFVHSLSFGNRPGNTIKINERSKYYEIFKEIFKSFNFLWYTDFEIGSHYKIKEVNQLALNRINKPVASIIDCEGNGKIIFFPVELKRTPNFYINLIQASLKILGRPPEVSTLSQVPPWLSEITVNGEKEVIETEKSVNERKENIFRVKQLLFETGSALVSSVKFVFEMLGYKVKNVENLGNQDIEISRDGFKGIVEVKGLERCAKQTDLRQLMDYWLTSEAEFDKGIFVVNHYRNEKPNKRKVPYHEECIKKANKVGFCLITSLQLFKIYNEIIVEEDMTKMHSIRRKIEECEGLLDF